VQEISKDEEKKVKRGMNGNYKSVCCVKIGRVLVELMMVGGEYRINEN